jgi:hypothetical protein
MGVWGTGLYCDDTACDVKNDYKDILGEGISEPEATNRLIEEWKNEVSDLDVEPVFWLTLADVQWNLGRLQVRVKQKALLIIDKGTDLSRWISDEKLVKKRKLVLERLKQKLETDQPVERKVKKRHIDSTEWRIGEVYSFSLQSGKLVLLHVSGFHQDKGGRGPVCEILDWIGEELPDKDEIEKLDYKYANEPQQHLSQFLFGSLGPRDYKSERVALVAKDIAPKQKLAGYSVILWRFADKQLETLFGIR